MLNFNEMRSSPKINFYYFFLFNLLCYLVHTKMDNAIFIKNVPSQTGLPYSPVHLHPYTYTPVHLHPYTYTPVHLHPCTPTPLYTYTPVHLPPSTPTPLYTYTPVHLIVYLVSQVVFQR